MSPGVSHLNDLHLLLDEGTEHTSFVPLFHHLGRFAVKRGAGTVRVMPLRKLFYRIELTVTGALKIAGFGVAFTGIPAGVDYAGNIVTTPVVHRPELTPVAGSAFCGALLAPRFADGEQVILTLTSGTRELGRMALSEFLAQHDTHIDFTAPEVVIPIRIEVGATEATIVVNDWDEGAIQIPIIGH